MEGTAVRRLHAVARHMLPPMDVQPEVGGDDNPPPESPGHVSRLASTAAAAFRVPLGERQLFVLESLGIAATHDCSRPLHPPVKQGAVVLPDLTSTGDSTSVRSAPHFDPGRGQYRIPVTHSRADPDDPDGGCLWHCSVDGV